VSNRLHKAGPIRSSALATPSALAIIDPGLLAKSDPHRAPEEAVRREANGGNSRLGPTGKTNWFGENELVTRKRDLSLALVLFLPWGKSCSWCAGQFK